MKKFKRIFVIVADSLGVGELPDAEKYNDVGANTLGHIANKYKGFNIPTLEKLGIGYLTRCETVSANLAPNGIVGKMGELSVGKDTLTGHFEIMGLEVKTPFPSFTDTGFPIELIEELEKFSGRKVIGNISASGTEIIKDLGEEQLATGALIVYTSADSVLQIAANEEIIPLEELYRICEYARKITIQNPEWMVGRIIARPFVGTNKENFKRTTNRHDYALKPFGKTVLNSLKDKNYDVIAVGKINDIFNGEGVTKSYKTVSNSNGMDITIDLLKEDFTGLCFVNLVDFDALYGHRRDLDGYANAIMEFDLQLYEFIQNMNEDDLVMVVADHGNDPVHHGTDHTREYTPLVIYHHNVKGGILPVSKTFAVVGATIADNFEVEAPVIGESILERITK
ncbi:MAG: phosphopentomutase [Bacilli bacterium]|nr:phosphopentomutase [Bacilli bacterium]